MKHFFLNTINYIEVQKLSWVKSGLGLGDLGPIKNVLITDFLDSGMFLVKRKEPPFLIFISISIFISIFQFYSPILISNSHFQFFVSFLIFYFYFSFHQFSFFHFSLIICLKSYQD